MIFFAEIIGLIMIVSCTGGIVLFCVYHLIKFIAASYVNLFIDIKNVFIYAKNKEFIDKIIKEKYEKNNN